MLNAGKADTLSTARTIRTNLGSTSTASFDGSKNITPGVTGTLPIANGGTGATTAAAALTNLGITATAAELNKMDGVTATTTELNYVDGVTSNIQTQLNSKLPLAGGTMTGALTVPVGADAYANPSILFGSKAKIGMTSDGNTFGFYTTGTIKLRPNGGTMGYSDGIEISTTSLIPTKNNTVSLGTSSKKWSTVYATSFSGSGASLTSLNAGNISSGTLAIARGGTGATTAAAALTSLGAAASNHTHSNYAAASHTHSYIGMSGSAATNCNTQYDTSYRSIAAGSNCPSGNQYGSLLTMAYRKQTGNTTPDFSTQIFIPNGDDSTQPDSMYYRTSLASSWRSWQRVLTDNNLRLSLSGTTLTITKS